MQEVEDRFQRIDNFDPVITQRALVVDKVITPYVESLPLDYLGPRAADILS
jgi:hypothetical protein